MRRRYSFHPNQFPPILTKFVQLVFDGLSIKLAGQKCSLNSKRNDLVFPFIHICLKKLFLPNASGSYWPSVARLRSFSSTYFFKKRNQHKGGEQTDSSCRRANPTNASLNKG